jgi:hypothetical protein
MRTILITHSSGILLTTHKTQERHFLSTNTKLTEKKQHSEDYFRFKSDNGVYYSISDIELETMVKRNIITLT